MILSALLKMPLSMFEIYHLPYLLRVILHLEPSTYTVVEPKMKLILIKLHPNS